MEDCFTLFAMATILKPLSGANQYHVLWAWMFIDFLLSKKKESNVDARFDFSWEGDLSDMKGQYTSVGLQHRAADWI